MNFSKTFRLYAIICATYSANFIETADMVLQIGQFKL